MIDDTIKAAIESQEVESYYDNDNDDEISESDDEFGDMDKDGFGNDDDSDDREHAMCRAMRAGSPRSLHWVVGRPTGKRAMLEDCDLSGLDLSHMNFSDGIFMSCRFEDCEGRGVKFTGAIPAAAFFLLLATTRRWDFLWRYALGAALVGHPETLDAVLARDPSNPQAWATRAAIELVALARLLGRSDADPARATRDAICERLGLGAARPAAARHAAAGDRERAGRGTALGRRRAAGRDRRERHQRSRQPGRSCA